MNKLTVKEFMKLLKVNQDGFAKLTGFSNAYISKLSNNKIQLTEESEKILQDFASKYNVELVFDKSVFENLSYKARYEKLLKQYDMICFKCLQLMEENNFYRQNIDKYLNFAEKLKEKPKKKISKKEILNNEE